MRPFGIMQGGPQQANMQGGPQARPGLLPGMVKSFLFSPGHVTNMLHEVREELRNGDTDVFQSALFKDLELCLYNTQQNSASASPRHRGPLNMP